MNTRPATPDSSGNSAGPAPINIAVTTGDPAGVGPDVVLMLVLSHVDYRPQAQMTVIGDRSVLAGRARALGLEREFSALSTQKTRITLRHVKAAAPVVVGTADPRNAAYVLEQIDVGVAGCLTGDFDALVTAPVDKATINKAGIVFPGHTEYLADTCDCDTVMMLVCEEFRVALATTHLPLKMVPQVLTREGLKRTLRIVNEDMRRLFGVSRPRIAVCGLNPHAGENGCFGTEEKQVIQPVLKELTQGRQKMDLTGPLPADTAFTPRQLSQCDVVVAMYHDQGLPVIKHAAFERTVNLTLGLPFIRTSVDHGTALSLAGSGKASPASLGAAVCRAIKLGGSMKPDPVCMDFIGTEDAG